MEVAGQWRREWAGTAEYGKVIEGGVTRRVARAMEVLNASGPGARVRVMRAAYHSSSGPGAPTASYLMHSSRQVLSSGFNFLETPSQPSKPLEISSTPLYSSPDSETENYKVTEPDDFEISEPSKWRRSTGTSSIRMPSEESSSADNASIIDLDSRSSSRSPFRRSFNGKHDVKGINVNKRVSPLLDAPTALSTLKYTSLLNASDEWNNRRKSYSFEDTSPLNKGITDAINLSIDSSTDSGICKSTELFNDSNNSTILKNSDNFGHTSEIKQDFKDWLSKNRRNMYKEIKLSPPKSVHIDTNDSNITLQSSGKVTITLPVDVTYSEQSENQSRSSDENDRKTKKVEFCKTELHFTADTGTVNIIATDEKPPPSNDFRRRKSAFVPLNQKSDRPITLFGLKSEISEIDTNFGTSNYNLGDSDENTAATKGILKNKIPKPKPYLLGENMAFGTSNNQKTDDFDKTGTVLSAVSLINRQLQCERRYSNDTTSSAASELDLSPHINKPYRTPSKDPQLRGNSNQKLSTSTLESSIKYSSKINNSKPSSVSPTPSRSQIRELRGSELAYFGISNDENRSFIDNQDNLQEEILHSVKLVQKISNSVCNSEAESDDGHDYQNVPINYNLKLQPIPTPKPRTKYSDSNGKITENRVLQSITEQDTDLEVSSKIHQNILNNFEETVHPSRNKTKNTVNKENVIVQKSTRKISSDNSSLPRNENNSLKREKNSTKENGNIKLERKPSRREVKKPESPIYVNVDTKTDSAVRVRKTSKDLSSKLKNPSEKRVSANSRTDNKERILSIKSNEPIDKSRDNHYKENKEKLEDKRDQQSPLVKKRAQKRTEKLCTPENPPVHSVRQSSSVENKIASKRDDVKYKSINGSLNKNNVHSTSKNYTGNGSLVKKEKESEKEFSKRDTIKIPKITTVVKQIQSDDTSNSKKTTSKSHRDTLNSQQSLKSNQIKVNNVKLDKPIKPHRSKYVINYDDKNGTVSSVCKIKTGPGTYKRKIIPIESKNHEPTKGLNKIALLNLPDPQWIQDKDRKKRKSTHDQRSCQLL